MKKRVFLTLFGLLAIGFLATPAALAASGCCPSMCCASGAACCH